MRNKLILSIFLCLLSMQGFAYGTIHWPGGPSAIKLCVGSTIELTEFTAITTNTWTTSGSSIATVSPIAPRSALVTAVSPGAVTITNVETGDTIEVRVYQVPDAIGGSNTVCEKASTTLTSNPTGGVWASFPNTTATIGASTGIVTGSVAGVVNISYNLTTTEDGATYHCAVGLAMTVLHAPIQLTPATTTICVGSTITLSDHPWGSWTEEGTFSETGASTTLSGSEYHVVVTGGSTAIYAQAVYGQSAGTSTITYTLPSDGCTSVSTVNVISADAGTITGPSKVCIGNTINLADVVSGGVWSSSTPAVASISAIGVVTGIAAGTTTISYAITNACGSNVATMVVTVETTANAGSISGNAPICAGSHETLIDGATGGVWSSTAPAVATVTSVGYVSGITPGTATISYTVTNSCGSVAATVVVTVDGTPDAGSISGNVPICVGGHETLVDGATGGVWSSTAPGVATVTSVGYVTGVSPGTATISVIVTNSCGSVAATAVVTVDGTPDAGTITGTNTVCVGLTTTLMDAATGTSVSWSSSNTSVATVAVISGVVTVTGVATGTATISYSVTNGCGTAVATDDVTVGSCCLTSQITVNTGYDPVANAAIAPGSNGGTPVTDPKWFVYNISDDALSEIAAAGNTAVSFSPTASNADVVDGSTVTGGGGWDNDNAAYSSWISCQNDVKYNTEIDGPHYYNMTLGRKFKMCADDDVTLDLYIAVDNIIVSGSAYIDDPLTTPLSFGLVRAALPDYTQYFDAFTHYTQTVSLSSGEHVLYFLVENYSRFHDTPNPTGLNIYGTLTGTGSSLVMESDPGCSSYTCPGERHSAPSTAPTVAPITGKLVCFPNPNDGSFTLRGALSGTTSKEASIEVVDMMGKVVYRDVAGIDNGGINQTINLGDNIANGVYLIKVISGNSNKVIRISVNR